MADAAGGARAGGAGTGPDPVVLILQSDGGDALLAELDTESFSADEVREPLTAYLTIVRESLAWLCALPEFKHVQLCETSEGGVQRSPICLGAGSPQAGPDGQVQSATAVRPVLDIQGLLTAQVECSDAFGAKVGRDEEGVIQILDTQLDKKVDRLLKALKPIERLQSALTEEQELLLVDALNSLCPPVPEEQQEEEEEEEGKEEAVMEPVHPADLLILLAVYMVEVVGEAPPQANPLKQVTDLIGGVLGAGARRIRALRKVVWKVEDIAVGGAKLAARVARHSLRPVFMGVVLHRVLQTLDRAASPEMRLSRLSPADQLEHNLVNLLGPDWQQQMEQDFLEAAREVQEGYMTDDYLEEKRKMTAAMLRRLEIEDWDKERMKHFYYGSYGLGSWYFDMEERLHNPFFMGARGWNGPIEQWVGKNKRYADDIPSSSLDFNTQALGLLESRKGVRLTPQQRQRIAAKNRANPTDLMLSNDILTRVVDKAKLKQALS